ncbi:MAG: response regulator transcription factor [Gammaproteobacteria bacterium]|nr:response regulator transcription factor [Gammaproteobacteria bacterium]
MNQILIVDDDSHIRDVLRFALDKEGFDIIEAENGSVALQKFSYHKPDLIILDIMMPELDGISVCRELRQSSNVPIIFLSSKDEEIDRILGLELGGDDYITKPFSPRELVARARAVLRRVNETPADQTRTHNLLQHGRLKIDQDQFKVFWLEHEVVFTVTEFGLLRVLIQQPGRVFSREALMDAAYDFNNVVSDRTIDSHMRRVRAKLKAVGASPVETVHGVGYKLGAC